MIDSNNVVTVGDLTWPEVQERLDKGCKIAVLPVGHTEQHGPHLPFSSDTYFISEATKRGVQLATKESGKPIALVFPTLPYGNGGKYANGEMRLRPSTLISIYVDIIRELSLQGFQKTIIASGHGSNWSSIADGVNEAHRIGLKQDIFIISPWSLINKKIEEIKETKITGHACEIETSTSLYLFPELVHLERIQSDEEKEPYWYLDQSITAVKNETVDNFGGEFKKFTHVSSGYVGNPKKASKEKGEILINTYVREFTNLLLEISK